VGEARRGGARTRPLGGIGRDLAAGSWHRPDPAVRDEHRRVRQKVVVAVLNGLQVNSRDHSVVHDRKLAVTVTV
jgi:hypothetical protein